MGSRRYFRSLSSWFGDLLWQGTGSTQEPRVRRSRNHELSELSEDYWLMNSDAAKIDLKVEAVFFASFPCFCFQYTTFTMASDKMIDALPKMRDIDKTGVCYLRAPDLKRVNSFKIRTSILINIIMVLIRKSIQRRTIIHLKRSWNVRLLNARRH